MSAAVPAPVIDAAVLRPKIVARIERMPACDLPAVERALLEIEARRLSDELGAELAEDWKTGALTEESINEAVLEHRRKHPYR